MNLDFFDFKPDLPERGSFVGTLQTTWDSTSITALKRCPREYYYNIVCGVTPTAESIHLRFGIVYHAALERYDRAKCEGMDHESALLEAVKYALVNTWEARLNRPWISDHDTKNRFSLVQTIVDYLDHFTGDNEALITVRMPDGQPAVELSFSFKTNYMTPFGQPYAYNGHIDRLVTMHDMTYITDRKTTGLPLNDSYYSQYTPNNQMSGYDFAGQMIFKEPIHGLIIDAVQITKKQDLIHTTFSRKIINRTDGQREEWYRDLGIYISLAESYSRANYWPMNDQSCVRGFFKCPYFSICVNGPEVRKTWSRTGFGLRFWDPSKFRGPEVA